MTEAELAAIEARHKARNYSASRNHGHMSEMDAIEAHTDCAALLAEVERLGERERVMREAAKDIIAYEDTGAAERWLCWDEKFERLRAALGGAPRLPGVKR